MQNYFRIREHIVRSSVTQKATRKMCFRVLMIVFGFSCHRYLQLCRLVRYEETSERAKRLTEYKTGGKIRSTN